MSGRGAESSGPQPGAGRGAERLVGVVSDTHGLVRDETLTALEGCDLVVHAGDVGRPEVLETLGSVAPVVAVRGNVDRGPWAEALPETEVVEVAGAFLYLLHDLSALDLDPAAAGFQAVISGHSHQPRLEERKGVLYLNPGSAGPRRFSLPIAMARLRVCEGRVRGELVDLADPAGAGGGVDPARPGG